jgi:di/tricarboxylate transporter
MLTLPGIIVLIVIGFIILSLYLNIIGSGFTFTIGIIALGFARILTPKEILAGFANEQIAVIVMLIIIADIIRKSGALDNMFRKVFDRITTYRQFLGRMTLIVASVSSFVNKTPLVAIMIPFVSEWSKKKWSFYFKIAYTFIVCSYTWRLCNPYLLPNQPNGIWTMQVHI